MLTCKWAPCLDMMLMCLLESYKLHEMLSWCPRRKYCFPPALSWNIWILIRSYNIHQDEHVPLDHHFSSKIYRQEARNGRLTCWEERYLSLIYLNIKAAQMAEFAKYIKSQVSIWFTVARSWECCIFQTTLSYFGLNVLQRFNLEDTMNNSSDYHSIFKMMRIE